MDDIKQRKPKKTVEEQISHMKNKGITFNYISDEEARKYLSEHTFYFKFKAYAKNYEKYNTNGKYINLDFSYLQDLARLDMYFREIVLKITIRKICKYSMRQCLRINFIKNIGVST